MPNPRAANCIFCDDIRSETGNKVSLMGIYDSDIIFTAPPPAVMPKFCIVAWVISDVNDRPSKLDIRILVPPGRTELVKLEADPQAAIYPYDPDELSRGI